MKISSRLYSIIDPVIRRIQRPVFLIILSTVTKVNQDFGAQPVRILAIESSCDDTSAAVSLNNNILSNIIAGQEVHRTFGGVVPELASRAHQCNIVPVVDAALQKANLKPGDLDAVACTFGPGLMGSLLVGASFAKSLAQALEVPLIAVDHMKAHILAHMVDDGSPIPEFPFLCLTVSGGHTQLVVAESPYAFSIIGATLDDAAGEAFDKAAKLLGLPYPGGPQLDKRAQLGNPEKFPFTVPRIEGLNYSFSGLKTQILYFLRQQTALNPDFVAQNLNDLCASVQHVIVQFLLQKLKRAAQETGIKHVALSGGVSANSLLRSRFTAMGHELGCQTYIPAFEFCTDNAGMIAIAGYYQYLQCDFIGLDKAPTARQGL
jgi:N6-L-threonylcarbamoyladenine synthase